MYYLLVCQFFRFLVSLTTLSLGFVSTKIYMIFAKLQWISVEGLSKIFKLFISLHIRDSLGFLFHHWLSTYVMQIFLFAIHIFKTIHRVFSVLFYVSVFLLTIFYIIILIHQIKLSRNKIYYIWYTASPHFCPYMSSGDWEDEPEIF